MSEWGYNNKRTETFDHQPSIKQARLRKKRKRKKGISGYWTTDTRRNERREGTERERERTTTPYY